MFIACPVTFILEDAEWFDDIDDAKENALDWSVELSGENVIVYEAIEGNYGYDFKPLSTISA
jgi:hypothetical protein